MAIGDTVGALSVDGHADATFTLVSNPNDALALAGNILIQAANLPNGTYQITIRATAPGVAVSQPITLIHGVADLTMRTIITSDGLAIGGTVTKFATDGAPGPFTYTLVSNPGSAFSISGDELLVNAVLSVGDIVISVHSTNGTDTITQNFTISVLSVADSWVPGIRPFSITSPVNTLLPTDSNYWDVLMPASTGSNYFTNPKCYLDQPPPSETTVCTMTYNAGWGHSGGSLNRVMSPHFNGWTGDTDKEGISVNGTNVVSIFQLNRTSSTTAITNQQASCDALSATGFGTSSPFLGAGVLAAGCSILTGALLKEEFTRYGTFNHQISFSGVTTLVNFGAAYPPAISNDGQGSDGIGVEGQTFAIPPGTSKPSGLSIYGEAIWQAGIDYGFILVDIGGSFTWYPLIVFDENNPGNNYGSANSWSSADMVLIRADTIKIMPLIKRTGYPLDGLPPMGLDEAWSPQIQVNARAQATLMRITRDSDSTFLDVAAASTVTGLINSAAISTFSSGTIGRLSAFYGQVHAFHGAAVGAVAPIIYQSGALETINGIPAAWYDGANNYLTLQSGRDLAAARTTTTFSAIVQIPDHAANYAIFGTDAVGGFECRINASTGYPQIMTNSGTVIATGTVAVPINTPTFIKFLYGFSNGNWSIRVNGADAGSGTNLVATTAGTTLIGAGSTSSDFFKGHIGAVFTTLFSWGGARALHIVETYMQDFWGTP